MASSTIRALAAELTALLRDVDGIEAVYLFGSVLREPAPVDVDLVVVYRPPLMPITAPIVRGHVEESVARSFDLPAHLVFLSTAEAEQAGLLADLRTEMVFEARG